MLGSPDLFFTAFQQAGNTMHHVENVSSSPLKVNFFLLKAMTQKFPRGSPSQTCLIVFFS